MHGIGTFIWVLLLIIGVISSIRKTARQQAQQRGAQRAQGRSGGLQPTWWEQQPPEAAPPPPSPPPAASVATPDAAPAPSPALVGPPLTHRARLFSTRQALVGAVIASEVLGKPRGLYPE